MSLFRKATPTLRYAVAGPFRRRLMAWYAQTKRDLPWRRTRDAYKIFVSEIMLQQTQAKTVQPYYERFLKALPTVESLAKTPPDRLMKLWEGLGYYARARNLQAAARQIMDVHRGKIPRDPQAFSDLPGVGPYTTGAVLSIAYGLPLPAVDGNVKRVIARLFDIGRPIKPMDDDITRISTQLLSRRRPDQPLCGSKCRRLRISAPGTPSAGVSDAGRRRPGDFNQAMMELGATVCTPARPRCPSCPVRTFCRAFRNKTTAIRPVKSARRARPHYRVVAAILRKNGNVLLGRRPDRGLLGGLWEFPGGKIERGESAEVALRREIREELGIDATVGPQVSVVRHAYTHFSITLSGHLCAKFRGDPIPRVHSALRWVPPARLNRFAMPEANRKLLRDMKRRKLI